MELKTSILARKVIVAFALAIAMILSWFSIRIAIASHYAGLETLEGYAKATQLEPSNASYWDLLGLSWQMNLEHADLKRAIECYRVSLSLDSLSATTWLDLASAYEEAGSVSEARTAYLQAKHVYPSSADVAWRYGNFLLRQGELDNGFIEIHHAVEAEPVRGLEAFLTCRHFEPNFDRLLNQVIPQVAHVYLDILWRLTDEGDTNDGLKVVSRLLALRPRLTQGEIGFFVGRLANKGQVTEAAQVWREATPYMGLPRLDDPPGSLIWDGGFETDITNNGFGWRLDPVGQITTTYDSNTRHSGKKALRVDISKNDYSSSLGVCHPVVLELNSIYKFSAWLRTRDLPAEGGIMFRLVHPSDEAAKSVMTDQLPGTNDWTKVSVNWKSPDHLQVSQVCLWREVGAGPNEHPAVVWVDDVTLLKLN